MDFVNYKYFNQLRRLLPLPMLCQMSAMLFMASNGRPNIAHIAPDWILHIMAYSILGLLAWIAWLGILPAATKNIGITLSIATTTLFSLLDEGLQILTPTKTAQISDLAADFIDVIISLFLITLFLSITSKKDNP